jgi:hypothetical protein
MRASNVPRLRPHKLGRATTLVIRFPPRSISAVVICRERDGGGWITLAGAHGWVFGSLADARLAARWLARNFGLPIRESVS